MMMMKTTRTVVLVVALALVASVARAAPPTLMKPTPVVPIQGFAALSVQERVHVSKRHVSCKQGHRCPLHSGFCCRGGEVCCPTTHPCDNSGKEIVCQHSHAAKLLLHTIEHSKQLDKQLDEAEKHSHQEYVKQHREMMKKDAEEDKRWAKEWQDRIQKHNERMNREKLAMHQHLRDLHKLQREHDKQNHHH